MVPDASQVRILAVGRDEIVARLRRWLPRWCVLTSPISIADAMTAVQSRKCDVLVLDASLLDVQKLSLLLSAASDASVSGFTQLDPRSAARIAQAVVALRCEVVAIGADNEGELLGRYLSSAGSVAAPALILSELAVSVVSLPVPIRAAIVALFSGMQIPHDVPTLAAQAQSSERQLERSFAKQGLASPKQFLVAARVARTWDSIAVGDPIGDVAHRHGWHSADPFRAQFRRLIGASPTEARSRMQVEGFARRLASALRQRDPM